ncbi:DUF882 domain-containing protein [Taklimakanibacter deserti]|uniref:DUF882 domain-containing protein n=1 Tax=Taklimakanibacter deserti TaxID=2267839 RepID=UPI0013C53592
MTAGLWFGFGHDASAGGETRTLSLYHVHTKESLTITYKVDGRYIPSALEKINYLMRDWRRKEVIRIDPKTIDLMWELHADLGSTRPIHIICGYRSPKTNSFLKRIGRNVAKKSQHMIGKAIDLYFPDISTEKLRNSALVRQVGGVGYYRSSGPSGFVHIDSGKVRAWPRIAPSQMARIFRDYRKTIGARINRDDQILVASAETDNNAMNAKLASIASTDYDEEDAEETAAETTAQVETKPAPTPRVKPAQRPVEVVDEYPVPLPRPKPIEVLMMAAANMQISPAAAPPADVQTNFKSRFDSESLGVIAGAESMAEEPDVTQTANVSAKGSFADSLRDGTADNVPLIKPLSTASAANDDLFWWPKQLTFSPEQAIRRDGAPQEVVPDDSETIAEMAAPQLSSSSTLMVAQANAALPPKMPALQSVSSGKGDLLEVNRSTKGSMLTNEPVAMQKKRQSLGQFIEDVTDSN